MSVIQPLLDLQEIDSRIRTLQQEAKDIPHRKEQENARLNGARAAVEQAKADLKAAQARVSEAELEAKAVREKILGLKKNQAMLKTNKEFQAYNLEIDGLEKEAENFDARTVAAMDTVPPKQQLLAELETKLADEKSVVDTYLAELDARLAEVNAELAQEEKNRHDVAKNVSPRPLLIYERTKSRRWPAVVPLQEKDGVCKGCNIVQSPGIVQMARRNQDIVMCQMCGRILYI